MGDRVDTRVGPAAPGEVPRSRARRRASVGGLLRRGARAVVAPTVPVPAVFAQVHGLIPFPTRLHSIVEGEEEGQVGGSGRRKSLRWSSLLTALLLFPSLAPDVFGVACPHHAGHQGHDSRSMAQASGGAPPTPHASPTHDRDVRPTHHAGSRSNRPDHGPEPCTCVGRCPVAEGPSAPAVAPRVTAFATVEAGAPAPPHTQETRRSATRFLQPPANAPPSSV